MTRNAMANRNLDKNDNFIKSNDSEGKISSDGELNEFKSGIDKVIAEQPVPVVPMALCHLWGSMFSRRDPLYKRRPYKLWSLIELRIGEPIPAEEVNAARLQQEVQKLRGDDK